MKTSCNIRPTFIGFFQWFIPLGFLLFIAAMPVPVSGQSSPVSLALLPFENMNNNPDQDYLNGIISSILEEDLSSSGALHLVERENLQEVMEEQKLQYTGLMDDKNALETGRLLEASYMLKGSFVFLGQDIFINITLIEVETGRTRAFSKRGYQENTVHALSEELIEHMTGKTFSFQKPEGEKSILARLQQEPGTVELFSYIVDARVYIDEEFVGYTTGDKKVPLVLTVEPGRHTIRTHLTKNFGVVTLPEITFSDWEEEFELLPGGSMILQDKTKHFNETLFSLQQVIWDRIQVRPKEEGFKEFHHSESFVDRDGQTIMIELALQWEKTETPELGGKTSVQLAYNGEPYSYEYFVPQGKELNFEETIGKVQLQIEWDCNNEWNWDWEYGVWRNDIYQGLHQDEYY